MLVWKPAWHRRGESLWAALNKVAFSTDTSVAEALKFITGLDSTKVRGATLASEARVAVLVCDALQLAFSLAVQLFAGVAPLPLSVRQYLQLGLRWCPECLACGGFHAATFQDWRVERCPWHGCQLLDRCPSCRCPVDPLCERAWTCNACGTPLYQPPRTWVSDFRAVPEFLLRSAGAVTPFFQVSSATGLVHFIHTAPEAGAGRSLFDRDADILVTRTACEELLALADTVIAEHRDCLARHAYVSMLQYKLVRCSCPAAAAAVRVGAWMGVGPMSMEAGWGATPRGSGDLVHRELQYEMAQMPAWCRRLYVQACLRAWLMDAFEVFKTAAAKDEPAEWRPSDSVRPDWFFRDGTFSLNKTPDLAALDSLASVQH